MKKKYFLFFIFSLLLNSLVFSDELYNLSNNNISSENSVKESVLTVSASGYYFIQLETKNKTGASMKIIDRMLGEIASAGETGKTDGGNALYLEKGDYKIRIDTLTKVNDTVSIYVREFTEINKENIPSINEINKIETDLKFCEQASYKLYAAEKRYFFIEAEGKNLSDVRILRDGEWQLNIDNVLKKQTDTTGKDYMNYQFFGQLEPGFYTITFYFGIKGQWAKDDNMNTFRLRYDLQHYNNFSKINGEISKFGTDYYSVDADVNFIFFQTPQKKKIKLGG